MPGPILMKGENIMGMNKNNAEVTVIDVVAKAGNNSIASMAAYYGGLKKASSNVSKKEGRK